MFNRIAAKTKSKTLIRTRSFFDFFGMALILAALAAVGIFPLIAAIGAAPFISTYLALRYAVGSSILTYLPGTVTLMSGLLVILGVIAAYALGLSVTLLFRAGMNRAALRMNRGDKNVRISDILLAGDRLGRYIKITLWQGLYIFLWNLPATVVAIPAVVIIGIGLISGRVSTASVTIAVLLVLAAIAWSVYITIKKYCQYYFAYLISEDNRDMTALDCVRESVALMNGHAGELFVTMLSFLGWNIVASLPFGSVFVLPYQYLTYASIYEQLSGTFQPTARKQMLWLNNGAETAKEIPAAENPAERKVEILSGEFAGSVIPVKGGDDIRIGRDPKRANVVTSPANTQISGLHCSIRYDAQRAMYVVIDHSTNGTCLNNEKLAAESPALAAKGSIVKLADGAMIVRLA